MNKIVVFLFMFLAVCFFAIAVNIFLSILEGSDLLSSDFGLDITGQIIIFLVFSLVFTFQKMRYKKIISLFLIFASLLVLADILILGFPNVRWNATIKMVSILISPFAGILLLKKAGEIGKKSVLEAEKEN
ncbi:MAG: hypothetical protein RLY61_949 [Candidatus Parcubacteria bacterium]|jgi:hypothetical protein